MKHALKTAVIGTLLGCSLANPAFAASKSSLSKAGLFSYNYAQISVVDLDYGYDGIKLDGSFDLNREMALIASYMTTDDDGHFDYDEFTLGAAYHTRLQSIPKSDLVLHGEFARASYDHRHFSTVHSHDDNGLRLGATLRYQAQSNIELFGDLSYESLFDNDMALTGGVNLSINPKFSVVGAIEMSDDDMLLLGLRMRLD
ncbi:MAG: hypothetical protein AB1810_07295 [Pseudomonadota bacterium]